ncbi:MAG: DUF3368 domain-containing protein [Cyanobacteria bacterium J06649_5]
MIVVSDTSAINNLTAIGQLILLKQLYGTVIIPEAVYQELNKPTVSAGGKEAKDYDWIKVQSVGDRTIVENLLKSLDSGESEAIALAIELNADLLLLDEQSARRLATQKGINRTGILGVLMEAKAQGILSEIRPLIEQLRNQADFWLSEALCNYVLQKAGEALLKEDYC